MYYYDKVTTAPFNSTLPVKTWQLGGFSEFVLHQRYQGPPNAVLSVIIYFDHLQGFKERITLDSYGFHLSMKTIPVAAPDVSILLSQPSGLIQADLRVYASCCGDEETPRMKPLSRPIDIKLLNPPFEPKPKSPRSKPKAKPRKRPTAKRP